MMRLRHLFDNPALAEMLVKNWEYDEPSLKMFQYFRISANAIYPFRRKGETCFLRFCPVSEKPGENIIAELEFIDYLRGAQYNALEAVPSRTGEELVQKLTPWGEYYASVFRRVAGEPVSESSFDDQIMFAYGAALGQLHKLSSNYTAPGAKRWTHVDVFTWIEETLRDVAVETLVMDELELLRGFFSELPVDQQTYGLIHYDFEMDNVFYDEATKSCSVIDFDDAMYHWYVMDIVQALDSLKAEIAGDELPQKQSVFMEGYRRRFDLDRDMFAAAPVFRRFASLYRYTRLARAVQEHWENEPEWLVELRTRLAGVLARETERFGKTIQGTH
jgi:Ser/Thr protein kinase RdoA (MazF antagonist)